VPPLYAIRSPLLNVWSPLGDTWAPPDIHVITNPTMGSIWSPFELQMAITCAPVHAPLTPFGPFLDISATH